MVNAVHIGSCARGLAAGRGKPVLGLLVAVVLAWGVSGASVEARERVNPWAGVAPAPEFPAAEAAQPRLQFPDPDYDPTRTRERADVLAPRTHPGQPQWGYHGHGGPYSGYPGPYGAYPGPFGPGGWGGPAGGPFPWMMPWGMGGFPFTP